MKKFKALFIGLAILLTLSGNAFAMNPLRAIHIGGDTLIGINRSTHINSRALAANTPEHITVPTGAKYVLLSATADFYASFTTTDAAVATDIDDGTGNALNPGMRNVEGLTEFTVISGEACNITAEFWQ